MFEVTIIILLFFALFIAISLYSFSPNDPSWSQQKWVAEINNAGGRVGAWIADLFFYTFGVIAYIIPLVIPLLVWIFFWKPKLNLNSDFLNISLRILGFLFTFFSMEGLSALNVNDFYFYPSGGLIGDIISHDMLVFFSLLVVQLILLTFFVSGITLLLGFSWLRLMDGIGSTAIAVISYFWAVFKNNNKHAIKKAPKIEKKKWAFLDLINKKKESMRGSPHNEQQKMGDFSNNAPPFDNTDYSTLFDAANAGKQVEKNKTDPFNEFSGANSAGANNATKNIMQPDFSHLPVHARPILKPKIVKNIAPFPSIDLLDEPKKYTQQASSEELEIAARLVEAKLKEFKINASVVKVLPGPVITRFELALSPGMKVSTVSSLEKDLARALSAMSVRVVDQIPGKAVIALELPNKHREIVYSSQVLGSDVFKDAKSPLSMALGVDISGNPVVVDLAKMPHLLVAGTTGSGKSVGVNCMLVSLLYKSGPDDVRMILIDPKMLELSVYEGIPHLLTEVVTDMKEAANALRWCVGEMERRYKLLSVIGVRTLAGYNAKVKEGDETGVPLHDPLWKPGDSMDEFAPVLEKLPNIVVVVDEFADMMMIVGKKCEELITRIAQKARAAGIHLILATQRPSVDVITGLIKANIPTRIAFQVSSKIDSRTILGMQGAETLLGHGDMLYLPPGTGVPTRVHGAFVDDHEVHRVVSDWKNRGEPDYVKEILAGDITLDSILPNEVNENDNTLDALFDEVVAFIAETRKVSISSIQRKFRIGYNRSARLVDQLETQGIISSPSGANSNRDVLAAPPH
ncbi:MAG: DNA translocase FtsK 4TM domain-containing protein [Psychromonas sp.]|nr:DNA translocase FtsK 4TM domain-containing protein [Psychromonas sp.]